MSWAEIKKAINSDLSMPLNELFYSYKLKQLCLSGVDGDLVVSSDQAIPSRPMFYNNVTINAGATLSGEKYYLPNFLFCNILTVNGTLNDVSGGGGASASGGAAAGGRGGGVLCILAKVITGNGLIHVNGASAEHATAPAGNFAGDSGNAGSYRGYAILGGIPNTGRDGPIYAPEILLPDQSDQLLSSETQENTGGGGGARGSQRTSTGSSIFAAGGTPGCWGGGGNAGAIVADLTGTGGSGGGGGGALIIFAFESIDGVSVEAKGGNGGNGHTNGSGAGGSGGGLITVVSPSISITSSSVAKGVGGIGAGDGSNGEDGEDGRIILLESGVYTMT